jgi:hypothetical protein
MSTAFPLPQNQTEYYRLDVKVSRCTSNRKRFQWSVREANGVLVATATLTYATEAEAFRAGNAAARAIRKERLS